MKNYIDAIKPTTYTYRSLWNWTAKLNTRSLPLKEYSFNKLKIS